MSAVKMVVIGVKEFSNRKLISDVLNKAKESYSDLTILNGGAKGVEAIAKEWAEMVGVPFMNFPIKWKDIDVEGADVREGPYGKFNARAGLDRNRLMLAEATHVLAFWDGVLRDTKFLTDYAKKQGLPVKILLIKGDKLEDYNDTEEQVQKEEEEFTRHQENYDDLDDMF